MEEDDECEKFKGNKIEDTKLDLVWKNIKCHVTSSTSEKVVLKGVSGHALHGEFLVIMGSSGAGKTTLLNILCKRFQTTPNITVTGEILANNQSIDEIDFSNYLGYVTQEDLLIPTMTVFETLLFIAKLRTNYLDKIKKVNSLIKELQLEKCKNSLIGNEYIRGVSGGEKKRVSIGVELITDPSILFLDEPTSGLDSYTALIVCKLLLKKASEGKTIISTIHQPNSDIFILFDKLMLMADGQVVYHGPAKDSVNFFADCGYVCPSLDNPPDYYMQLLHLENSNELKLNEHEIIDKLVLANKKNVVEVEPLTSPLNSEVIYRSSFIKQIRHLVQREFLRIIRNPLVAVFRLLVIIELIFFAAIIFRDKGDPSSRGELVVSSVIIYFYTGPVILINLLTTVMTFPSQLSIFQKEYQSNVYDVVPYCLSIYIVDFITDIILSATLVSSVYWVLGLYNSSDAILHFYAVVFLVFFVAGSFGNLIGSIVPKTELALMFIIPFGNHAITFAGYSRGKNLPTYTKWIEYTSTAFYSFQSTMKTQFEDRNSISCGCSQNGCEICDPFDIYDIKVNPTVCLCVLFTFGIALRTLGIAVNLYKSRKLKSLTQ